MWPLDGLREFVQVCQARILSFICVAHQQVD